MEGINNLGSTCAINSLIQMICRCKKLSDIILNANVSEGTFTYELKEVIDLIVNQNKSVNPMKFINYFYTTFNGIFNRYEQIDINELWFYIYEKIHEETAIIDNDNNKNEYDITMAIYNNNKKSDIMNLVQGAFINTIECSNCNYKSHLYEPFITFALDIQENKSIADLIVITLEDEIRKQDEWICDNCKNNHNYLKIKRIKKLPEILIISLNRFKDIYNKNNTDVFVNDKLIFNADGNIYNYELQSMGLHFGNLLGGHYMALCNINNETFNLYNDDSVKVINKDDFIKNNLLNNSVYLIIYQLNRL